MLKDRKIYDFNSVGSKNIDFNNALADPDNTEDNNPPIGPVTPIKIGYSPHGLLKMHTDLKSQIKNNFRDMIKTNWGERLMHYDFGGNLSSLAFELGQEDTDAEAIARIKRTTEKYMPYVKLITFETSSEKVDSTDSVIISIIYSVDGVTNSQIKEEITITSE